MKRALILLALLPLTACVPQAPTLVPVGTLVMQTMAAMPVTHTPTPLPSNTPGPIGTPMPAAFVETNVQLPASAAGAQCVPADTERIQARVTRVIDGDRIEVAVGDRAFVVQYLGIDAPGSIRPVERFGPEASGENRRLVASQIVTLVKDTSDKNEAGELLRYVFMGNLFLNYELLRQGLASAAFTAPDGACMEAFQAVEDEARNALLGVWSPTPVPTKTPKRPALPSATEGTVTATREPACACRSSLTCNNFSDFDEAQACLGYCTATGFGDEVAGLDKNENGIACEGLR